MPKILEHMEEQLLETTERILKEEGYEALSVRRLARECGTATGTIYNYFSGKNDLIAHVISKDWRGARERMECCAKAAQDFSDGMAEIYEVIAQFSELYRDLWGQYAKTKGSYESVISRHQMLRNQVELAVENLASHTGQKHLETSIPMLAECILAAVNQPDMNQDTVRRFADLLIK